MACIAAIASGCSRGTTTSAAPATTVGAGPAAAGGGAVTIKDFTFAPDPVTIATGQTVTFTNRDDSPHEPTFGAPGSAAKAFDVTTDGKQSATTPPLTMGPGTYTYYCAIHEYMTGKIVVQ